MLNFFFFFKLKFFDTYGKLKLNFCICLMPIMVRFACMNQYLFDANIWQYGKDTYVSAF